MIADVIQLPDVPEIHGLRFRHFRVGQDFDYMAAITRLSTEVDDTERADTAEELEKYFPHLTNCDPYRDMILAEVDPGDGRDYAWCGIKELNFDLICPILKFGFGKCVRLARTRTHGVTWYRS